MIFIERLWNSTWAPSNQQVLYRWLTKSLATVVLAIILAFTILLWPVSYLGFRDSKIINHPGIRLA